MKRILPMLLCCLLVCGCTAADPVPTQTSPTAPPPEITPVITEAPVTEPPGLVFTLYRGNENADGFVSEEVTVTEITYETVLEKLIDASVMPDTVTINSFSAEGNQLNIDFNQSFYDYLCTMGTSGELILIGSVVNTFLSAFQADSVFLTSDGEIMESGHVIYDFPIEYIH